MDIPPEIARRHDELLHLIQTADHEYHSVGASTITDAEYDAAVREVAELEVRYKGEVAPRPVGAKSTGQKIAHDRPMLSLDNVFNLEELYNFFKMDPTKPCDLLVEPKIDGLSLSLVYGSDGCLCRAVTRGDGREGDSVFHNAQVIPSIPKRLGRGSHPLTGLIEVRGEVFISKVIFEDLVKAQIAEGDEPFANARNAAAGSLKLKDSEECATRGLQFVAYEAFGLSSQLKEDDDVLLELVRLGFSVIETSHHSPYLPASDVINQERLDRLDEWRRRMPYETDGLVMKINNRETRAELGSGTRSPRWAVAFKFPPEKKATKLISVTWQVGRTGTVTPVAELEPVSLSGATVRRASLCNIDEIERLDIRVGDDVWVARAAEVIPKVLGTATGRVGEGGVRVEIPAVCPCCREPLSRAEGMVALKCTNYACPDQVFQRISHAVGKSSLDWDGCGDAQIRLLMSLGCRTLADLLIFQGLDALKPAARQKFITERERIKTVPLWRKYHALGLTLIGKTLCQDLARKYPSIGLLIEDPDGVAAIVGENRAVTLFKELMKMVDQLQNLESAGFIFSEEVKVDQSKTPLSGKVFCITGTLSSGSREAVAAKIETAGGTVKSSVTKQTDYLVIGEFPGGNKTKAAEKNKTKTITEFELYALLGLDLDVVLAASGGGEL